MAEPGRDAKRQRYTTAWHEGGHAVAGHLLGRQVDAIEVMGTELLKPPGEEPLCGFVLFRDHEESTIGDAIDDMTLRLAGEAAVRVCWALQVLDEVAMDVEGPIVPLSLDTLQAAPNGSTPAQHAGFSSYESDAARVDVEAVEEIAREWTDSGLAAAALVSFVRVRTADMVASERFQHHLGRIAAALLEVGSLSGELATDLLHRYDTIFKPTGGTHGTEVA